MRRLAAAETLRFRNIYIYTYIYLFVYNHLHGGFNGSIRGFVGIGHQFFYLNYLFFADDVFSQGDIHQLGNLNVI